jgi:8-oxo-dGTP pyrophosphatase MutT (NUDIX family)
MSQHTAVPVVGVVIALSRLVGGEVEYLVIRRSQYVSLPGRVCFPGGRVEAGESFEAAAEREMREELGVTISELRSCWFFQDAPRSGSRPSRGLELHGFAASLSPADQVFSPAAEEVAEVIWLTPARIRAHPDGLPNTAHFLDHLALARRA